MNHVVLTGRLTRDVDLRRTQSGKAVTTFSVAVDRRRKEDGADFVTCVAWNETAENMARFLAKGSRVAVSGRLSCRSFEKNGEKRNVMEVIADSVEFLDRKKAESPELTDASDDPDDIPF